MTADWQTLEQAALTLGISSRTLHRRIAKGEFQTRLENGRREVLVMASDSPSDNSPISLSDLSDTSAPATQSEASRSEPLTDVGHPVLALHEDRLRRTDLAILAYQQSVTATTADARRAHRSSRLAWSVAAVAMLALFVSAIWATHSVTQARADTVHLTETVRQLSDTSTVKTREADNWHQQADTARIDAARAQGELSAAQSQIVQLTQAQTAMQARFVVPVTPASDMSAKPPATTQTIATTQATAAAR